MLSADYLGLSLLFHCVSCLGYISAFPPRASGSNQKFENNGHSLFFPLGASSGHLKIKTPNSNTIAALS